MTPSTEDRADEVPSLLVAGDWHGNSRWAWACAQRAQHLGIGIVLQLGDFGIWDPRGTKAYLDSLEKMAVRCGLTIYPIGGNHENYDDVTEWEYEPDDDGFVSMRRHVRWIPRGHRWEWGGVQFGGLGGAFSIDWKVRIPGVTWWPEAEEVQPADVAKLGTAPLDVLVAHDAPATAEPDGGFSDLSPADQQRSEVSRRLLLDAVRSTRPSLVLHGHWHLRNQRLIQLGAHEVRVEGLASDQQADGTAWGVLDLPSLTFHDGIDIAGQPGGGVRQTTHGPRHYGKPG